MKFCAPYGPAVRQAVGPAVGGLLKPIVILTYLTYLMYNCISTTSWHKHCDHVGSRLKKSFTIPGRAIRKEIGFLFAAVFIGYQPHCLHFGVDCCMGTTVSLNFVVCPHRYVRCRNRGTKDLVSSWRRVTLKIIVRKRAAKIFCEIGNWLKKSKGSTDPGRAKVAKCWSIRGGLLNNNPTKIAGSSTAAEIRQSVSRCAKHVTGIASSFRGNSQLHSEHSRQMHRGEHVGHTDQ